MKQVISVSRRTDIPAFYSAWFINRLRAGYVYVQHPFSRKWQRVSLMPEDISALVFWSKNFSPFLSKLEFIERITKRLFFHFTITANRELEDKTPDYKDAINDFIFIAKRYSSSQIIWRFDPICITDKLSFEYYQERFNKCAEMLKGYAQLCYISFANPYKKVVSNCQKYAKQSLLNISEDKKRDYALLLADNVQRYGIQLYACCNDYLLSEKIKKGSCIDGNYLSKIFNMSVNTKKAPSRKECACTKSIDIGAYNTCVHGCLYCYANMDKDEASVAYKQHDPERNSLMMQVDEKEIELTEKQQSLFIEQI